MIAKSAPGSTSSSEKISIGRRVAMTRDGQDFCIEIEPLDQRDDGEKINSLSRELLVEAGKIDEGQPR